MNGLSYIYLLYSRSFWVFQYLNSVAFNFVYQQTIFKVSLPHLIPLCKL